MKARVKRIATLVIILVTSALTQCVLAQTDEPSAAVSRLRVDIPRTQLQKLRSSIDSQQYLFYIYTPPGYSDTSKTFPVLYLLDAQWDFPLVVGLFEAQWEDGFVPPLIIVGITWGGQNPDYGYLRFKDLTPTNNPRWPQSGNGPNFLSFMKKELIPFIDANYRTVKNDRILMGNSLG